MRKPFLFTVHPLISSSALLHLLSYIILCVQLHYSLFSAPCVMLWLHNISLNWDSSSITADPNTASPFQHLGHTHTHTQRSDLGSVSSTTVPYVAVSLNTGELASYQRKMSSFRTADTCSSFTKQIVVLLQPQGTICFSFSPFLHLSFRATYTDTYTASRKWGP